MNIIRSKFLNTSGFNVQALAVLQQRARLKKDLTVLSVSSLAMKLAAALRFARRIWNLDSGFWFYYLDETMAKADQIRAFGRQPRIGKPSAKLQRK